MKKTICRNFCALSTGTQGKPWRANWEEDTQPMSFDTVDVNLAIENYVKVAHDLRVQLLEKIKGFLAKAPHAVLKDDGAGASFRYYKLSDMDQLIEEIKANPEDERFLKSPDSSRRKLWDSNVGFNASNIKDYLRFQILTDSVPEIVLMRADLLDDAEVTSYKDQFRRPCEEGGHRAFKFHLLLEHDGQSMIAEGQLGHRDLEEYMLPKSLRNSERNLLEASRSNHSKSLRSIMQSAISEAAESTRHLRRAINYNKCTELGLDQLLDTEVCPETELKEALALYHRKPHQAHTILSHSTCVANAKEELGLISRALS